MPPVSFARERLNALYNHVAGDLTCRRIGADVNEKLNGVHTRAIEEGTSFALSPVTSTGELAFYALTGSPDDLRGIDERLPATLVTMSGDEITIIYALDGAYDGDPRFPEPDWTWSDEEIVAGDLENPPVYDAGLVARSLWQGPLNDATLYGVLEESQLALPLRLSFGRNSHEKKWTTQDLTFDQFLSLMTRHEEGAKDGKAFCQGEAIEGQRTKNAMKNLCLLGGDIDTGLPLEEVHNILISAGLTSILYTTHSHQTTRTAVSYDALVKWMKKAGRGEDEPTIDDVRAFLVDVRNLDHRVADTLSTFLVEQTKDGKQAIVEHAPMSKCRVVFPLAKPFDFAKEGKLHSDAIRKWAGKIRGVFKVLGISIDESCTDPSRLFYLPRHAKGRPYDVRVYAGDLLDLDHVEEVDKGSTTAGNAFLTAGVKDSGKDDGAGKDPRRFIAPDGTDVLKFAMERGDGFDICAFFDTHAADRIRRREGEKFTVECPFDGNHSNAGDVDDPGCFIVTAQPDQAQGFVFRCRHNACADHGSTDMLAEAVRLDWFPGAELYDPAFDVLPRQQAEQMAADEGEPVVAEEDEGEALAAVTKAAERLTEAASDNDILKILRALAKTHARAIQASRVIDIVVKKTGLKKPTLMSDYKALTKEVPKAPKAKKDKRKTDKLTFQSKDGFESNTSRLFNLLNQEQEGEPFLFRKDDALVIKTVASRTGIARFNAASFLKFRAYVADKTLWYGDTDHDVEPLKAVIEDVQTRMEGAAPPLDNIVTGPFFDADGSYYVDRGYHEKVSTYINADTSNIPELPERPSYEEMIACRDFLLEPFCDFPLKDIGDPSAQASRAHLMMMILQPLIRRLIGDEPTPLYAINKPQPGSGSSLLVQLVTIIHSGIDPASRSLPRNEDEIRKTISGILAQRDPVAWFDNVSQFVNSDILNATLTSTTHADRPMGQLASATFRNFAQWVITGNNLRFGKDLARRMVLIRLELDEAIDVVRDFKFPAVKEYVTKFRPQLVACALTLIRYWFQNRPSDWEFKKGPMLATFEAYSRIANSMLDTFEMPGFLENAAAGSDATDDETSAWASFMQAIYDSVGLGIPIEVGRVGGAFNATTKTLVQIFEEYHIEIEVTGPEHALPRSILREVRKRADSITVIKDKNGNRLLVKIRRTKDATTGGQRWVLVDSKDTSTEFG